MYFKLLSMLISINEKFFPEIWNETISWEISLLTEFRDWINIKANIRENAEFLCTSQTSILIDYFLNARIDLVKLNEYVKSDGVIIRNLMSTMLSDLANDLVTDWSDWVLNNYFDKRMLQIKLCKVVKVF